MNARKRRPARRKPQRWRAWGCAFAMGIVAAPLNTLALANSRPEANWSEAVAWSGKASLPHSSGSESYGAVRQPPRDLWGDVEGSSSDSFAERVEAQTPTSETKPPQELSEGMEREPDLLESSPPREFQTTEQDASLLPLTVESSENGRLDIRRRMIKTMGWTAVASHSSEVCATPGASGKPPSTSESSAREILDGFRAKGLGSPSTARAPSGSRTIARGHSTPIQTVQAVAHNHPLRHAKKPPRVTSVDSPEVVEPRPIQADFRLELIDAVAHADGAKPASSVRQLSGSETRSERLTSVSAVIAEVQESDEEPAIGTSQPIRLPPTKMPLLQGPVFGGVSDDDAPTAIPTSKRKPAQESVHDETEPTRAKEIAKDAPIRAGVSDAQEPIRAGVTDKREPVRAGASDEPLAIKASVSDDRQSIRAGVSDEGQPIRAGVSDDEESDSTGGAEGRSAELVIMPAMEVGPPRSPERVGVSDLKEWSRDANPANPGTDHVDNEADSEPAELSPAKPLTSSLAIVESVTDDELTPEDSALVSEGVPSTEQPQSLFLDAATPRGLRESVIRGSVDDEPYYDREPAALSERDHAERPKPLSLEKASPLPDSQPDRSQPAKSPAIYGLSDLDDEPSHFGTSPEGLIRLDLTSRTADGKPSRQRVTATGLGPNRNEPRSLQNFEQNLKSHGKMQLALRQGKLVRTTHEIVRTEVVNPTICEVVQFNTDEISVIGKQSGQTHVRVWFRGQSGDESTNYLVTVGSRPDAGRPEADEQEQLITTLTERYSDASFELVTQGDRVIVRGEVRRNEDAVQILSQIRRAWLVPVEDRLVVKR